MRLAEERSHDQSRKNTTGPIALNASPEELHRVSRALWSLLITRMDGTALRHRESPPQSHGMAAWRQLQAECEAHTGGRYAAVLRAILNPDHVWTEGTRRWASNSWNLHVGVEMCFRHRVSSADIPGSALVAVMVVHAVDRVRPLLRHLPARGRRRGHAHQSSWVREFGVSDRLYNAEKES